MDGIWLKEDIKWGLIVLAVMAMERCKMILTLLSILAIFATEKARSGFSKRFSGLGGPEEIKTKESFDDLSQ
jgi:hypothetical protein